MPISKNGWATTIPSRSMIFQSNTPSVASQTAATPPGRDSPIRSALARPFNRRGLHRTGTKKIRPRLKRLLCSERALSHGALEHTARGLARTIGARQSRAHVMSVGDVVGTAPPRKSPMSSRVQFRGSARCLAVDTLAKRDRRQLLVGGLLFVQVRRQQPYDVIPTERIGPRDQCPVTRDLVMLDRLC
jgi:hypothetical protein